MTYNEIYHLIFADSRLRNETHIALLKGAYDILNEDVATVNHADRVVLAKSILQNPDAKVNEVIGYVAMNAVIQTGTYTDGDIQWIINNLLNTLAQ